MTHEEWVAQVERWYQQKRDYEQTKLKISTLNALFYVILGFVLIGSALFA